MSANKKLERRKLYIKPIKLMLVFDYLVQMGGSPSIIFSKVHRPSTYVFRGQIKGYND